MLRLAVLGQPVAHSRSPAMHTAALEALGLGGDWSYDAIEVSPDELEPRLRAMPDQGFAGANVTVPHKLAALRLADRASDAARAIGAANTLTFTARGIEAENTDAPGVIDSLPDHPGGARALVLGAGGSARACAWALREAGAEVSIWNRTAERGERLASELGVTSVALPEGDRLAAGAYEVIVNATTVGLAAANAAAGEATDPAGDLQALRLDGGSLEERHVVVDLVYGPSATPLAAAARERGATVVDGLEVLVRQGARSLRLWTGLDPPIDVMRKAAREG
jgi:shikimate dehydrogenase